MGYLVCQDCKGYYKLQPGEKPEDFADRCTCGGKLKYAIDIEVVGTATSRDYTGSSFQQNNKKSNKSGYNKAQSNTTTSTNKTQKSNMFSCPDCGHKLSKKAKSCPNCGRELSYKDIHGHKARLTLNQVIVTIIASFFVFSIMAYIGIILNLYVITTGAILAFLFGLIIFPIMYISDRKKLKRSKIKKV